MKILQYNLYNGCEDSKRIELLNEWIKENDNYDVIGFNEMNNWSQEKLNKYASQWGFAHSYLYMMENSEYWMAVVSKFPIEFISTYEDEFQHGLLHVKINNINILLTHLVPFDSKKREIESRFIVNLTNEIEGPCIIMGDFNSLSPIDHSYYEENNVRDLLTKEPKLYKELSNSEINYKPIQQILGAGFHDLGSNREFQYSIPTEFGKSINSPIKRRIDYILVDDEIIKFNPITEVKKDKKTELISDHFPVECRW